MGAHGCRQIEQVSAADRIRTRIRLFEPRIYGGTDLIGGDDFRLQQLTDGGGLSHGGEISRSQALSPAE